MQPLLAPDEAVDCLSAGYHGEPGLLAAVEEEVRACSHSLCEHVLHRETLGACAPSENLTKCAGGRPP